MKVSDVFKIQGQPTITYVRRQDGLFEKRLGNALDSKGAVCLLTGPSKTGKTSLYARVLADKGLDPLQVRCSATLKATEFWRTALEGIDFERISQRQAEGTSTVGAEGKISGSIGWKWLAGLTGEASVNRSSAKSEAQIRERVLAEAGPGHLLPALRKLPLLLVIEDFHYLHRDVQKTIFQQWKAFVDSEVSVLIVGTTHHAADLAHANKDLVGRVLQVDLATWRAEDLAAIPESGFGHLKVPMPGTLNEVIASESVGLPIVTQATCLQLLQTRNIQNGPAPTATNWTREEVFEALHQVATERYSGLTTIYDRLTRGPRKKARRYNTYELVLSAFTLNPAAFSLHRDEIMQRLNKLPIAKSAIPPAGSLQAMFEALGRFQKKLGIEILEWSDRDQKLFVIEPAFLFFLRWRERRKAVPSLTQMLRDLIPILRSKTRVVETEVAPSAPSDGPPSVSSAPKRGKRA